MTIRSLSLALAVAAGAALILPGCGKEVTRTEPAAQRDLSGNWNATDVNQAAQELSAKLLAAGWSSGFAEREKRIPVVRIGDFKVRTQDAEYVNVDILKNALAKTLVNSGKVEVVSSRGQAGELREERTDAVQHADPATVKADRQEVKADFLLTADINTQDDAEGSRKQKAYFIDARLTSVARQTQVFADNVRITKDVSGASVR